MSQDPTDGRSLNPSSSRHGASASTGLPQPSLPTYAAIPGSRNARSRSQYELITRQQPLRGRQCSLGSRDRRPIDPPPIIQLVVYNPDGSVDENANANAIFSLQATVESIQATSSSQQDGTGSEHMFRPHHASVGQALRVSPRRLEGKTYSSGHYVKDLDGSSYGIFFVFPDLTIKDEGLFVLRFRLIVIANDLSERALMGASLGQPSQDDVDTTRLATEPGPSAMMTATPTPAPPPPSKTSISSMLAPMTATPTPSSDATPSSTAPGAKSTPATSIVSPMVSPPPPAPPPAPSIASVSSSSLAGGIMAEIVTEPFENFSAKRFPGSLESTPLTRALAAQGVLTPIRNFGSSGRRRRDG